MALSITGIQAFGDLLEDAQIRLDNVMHDLTEDAVQREMSALDELWAHYQELLDSGT